MESIDTYFIPFVEKIIDFYMDTWNPTYKWTRATDLQTIVLDNEMIAYITICIGSNNERYVKITSRKKGLFHLTIYYDADKQKIMLSEYLNARMLTEGKRVEYYENGNLKMEENWQNGNRNGIKIEYYESGYLKTKECWKNGWLDGTRMQYYESGSIKKIDNWCSLNHRQLRQCIKFDKDGKIES